MNQPVAQSNFTVLATPAPEKMAFNTAMVALTEAYGLKVEIERIKIYAQTLNNPQKYPFIIETIKRACSREYYRDSSRTALRLPTIGELIVLHSETALRHEQDSSSDYLSLGAPRKNDKKLIANGQLICTLVSYFGCDDDALWELSQNGELVADDYDCPDFSELIFKKSPEKMKMLIQKYREVIEMTNGKIKIEKKL
jgi:hypothetical protein